MAQVVRKYVDMDLVKLVQAREILTAQMDLAPDDSLWSFLDTAVRSVQRAIMTVELDMAVKPVRPTERRRIQVPDTIIRSMLASGRDLWVAELLGWGKKEVWEKRHRLGVAAFPPGGFGLAKALARTKWMTDWSQRLNDLHICP